MSSSSSSESDEEEQLKLRESVMGFELEAKQTQDKDKGTNKNPKKNLKSMRLEMNEDVRQSVLNTTPEFRNFVGKKLDSYFDSLIQDSAVETEENQNSKDYDSGIKLLANSSVVLKDEEEKQIIDKKKKRKKYSTSSSDDDDEMERLRSAAVTVDFVTNGSALNRNNKTKACEKSTKSDTGSDNEKEIKVKKQKRKKKKKSKEDTAVR